LKTLVLYYSYTGHTENYATAYAAKESADKAEIKDAKRPAKLKAYLVGCFASIRGKSWPIQPLNVDFTQYDRILLLSPIWAGNPPPAVNAAIGQLPEGKTVSVTMVSASGDSKCRDSVEAAIKSRGCTMDDFENVRR
jgi:flavodoxin